MNGVILQDDQAKANLLPFTFTRSAADLRVGILTIREKWEALIGKPLLWSPDGQNYSTGQQDDPHIPIFPSHLIPSENWFASYRAGNASKPPGFMANAKLLEHSWQIFEYNDWALREDFKLLTRGKRSVPISSTNRINSEHNIFVEEGAIMEHCILNASEGPIYIGKNAEVMEGCMLRGPIAICEGAGIKMGTVIYGATTIGPYCKVGGEIKNSVIMGYSNKGHHGYLGDSVIGEWCNLGAGSSNSNMKNSARPVKVWNIGKQAYDVAGTKCGLLMGDYSRCAINTSFNTGTVVGVCANIFNPGELTPKYIPNFSWGTNGESKYDLEKALEEIRSWMNMKNKSLSAEQEKTLRHIFEYY